MSGRLTVWVQPMSSLCPMVGNGLPKNDAPEKFQPRALWMCPSYHCPGPKKGWCGLMNSSACPEALRIPESAQEFEPAVSSASAARRGSPGASPDWVTTKSDGRVGRAEDVRNAVAVAVDRHRARHRAPVLARRGGMRGPGERSEAGGNEAEPAHDTLGRSSGGDSRENSTGESETSSAPP